jgi:hypothetical protein
VRILTIASILVAGCRFYRPDVFVMHATVTGLLVFKAFCIQGLLHVVVY